MKKIVFLFLLGFCCVSFSLAQGEYHKVEAAGSYSIMMANGIVGEGDVFSDDPDDPLPTPSLNNAFPNSTTLFPITPFSFSGNRHRANLQGFNGSVTYNFSKYVGAKVEISGNFRSKDVRTGTIPLIIACLFPACTAIKLDSPQISQAYRGVIVYPETTSATNQKHWSYLAGVQIKNNSKDKSIKPFAHIMAGVSRQSVHLKNFTDNGNTFDSANWPRKIFGTDKLSDTGLTMRFGGGLDIRLNRRIDIRVVQVDYDPVKIKEQQILGFQQAISGINIPNNLTFLNTASPDFTQYSPFDIRVRERWQHNLRIGFGIVLH